jgi:peptide/nickel transport system substrate-binding protein
MKRLIVLLVVLSVLATPLTVLAQEPGSGGPIIEGNGGTSVGSLNDIRCAGTDCRNVTRWLYPGLIGTDPELASVAPGKRDGILATDWTVSDDGTVYTFTLRDDMVWTDGEPITGWDFQFTAYGHMAADLTESAYAYVVADISDIAVSDDGYTLTVTFETASCQNLNNIGGFLIMPSHAFGWEPGMGQDFDWASLVDHEFDTAPAVAGGIFKFQSMDSERVVLTTNETWADGPVIPEGYLYVTVPDQTVLAERFIAGELNVADNPQNAKRPEIRANADLQSYDYPGNSWDYLALNLANPDNPQDGVELDADGNVVYDENDLPVIAPPQDPNPLFADVRVRRAIQMAINMDEIMEKAVLGEGTVMAANELPTSWALNPNLPPIVYDPEGAKALLAEAGWTPGDDGILVNADGLRFSFELLTNEGNTRRGQIGELVQQQLAQIGIEVDFVAIDFNQLLDIMDAQSYDAYILGWRNSYPVDPDQTGIFTSDADVVGSGFNNMSYINPEIDKLMKEAMNVPGCAAEDRAPIYWKIQEILQRDQAYIWLFAQGGFYAANKSVEGFGPYPNEMYWNADTWRITQ